MSLDIGYHVMSKEAIEEHGEFEDQLSVVEFLRSVKELEDLPYDMTVYGLDRYLEVSENPEGMADYIRGVLLDNVNFIFNKQPIVQFVVEDVEHWQGPVLPLNDEQIRLKSIFGGSLSQEGPGWYVGELNVQT